MSSTDTILDPNAAEPLKQTDEQVSADAGGNGAESADAQKSIETQKQEEEKAKPRLPAGVLQELADLRADRRALRELLAERSKGTEEKKAPALPQAKPKPIPGDFETTEAYLDARDEWVREDARQAAREEYAKAEQTREQKSEQAILMDEWVEREEAAIEKHPDYKDAVNEVMNKAGTGVLDLAQGPGKAAIAGLIPYSEMGPEILYFFKDHPEEVDRLCELSPKQAVLALGRIEARLAGENPGGGKPPSQTRLPKPLSPLKGTSAGVSEPSPDEPESDKALSDEDWMRKRNEQMRKRQGR